MLCTCIINGAEITFIKAAAYTRWHHAMPNKQGKLLDTPGVP